MSKKDEKRCKKSKKLLDFSYILCYTTYACKVKNNIYRKGCKKNVVLNLHVKKQKGI